MKDDKVEKAMYSNKVKAKIKNFNQTGYFDIVFEEQMLYPEEFNSSNLHISVIPNDLFSNQSDFELGWTVLKNESNIINMKVNFEKPLKISSYKV